MPEQITLDDIEALRGDLAYIKVRLDQTAALVATLANITVTFGAAKAAKPKKDARQFKVANLTEEERRPAA